MAAGGEDLGYRMSQGEEDKDRTVCRCCRPLHLPPAFPSSGL